MNDVQADEMITDIRELEKERERFETIAWNRSNEIALQLEKKRKTIDDEVQFKKDQLAAFFLTVDKKNSKTQQSYSLLSGKLVMKKATQKIVHDDKKILEWAEVWSTSYVDIKQVKALHWADLKKDLLIEKGKIINKHTGEVFENEQGLSIEEVKAQFEIK